VGWGLKEFHDVLPFLFDNPGDLKRAPFAFGRIA
jgi:hypothetical protein